MIARLVWVLQGVMLICDLAWWLAFYRVQPQPGSVLERIVPWLRFVGADSRFAGPTLIVVALVIDLSSRTTAAPRKERSLAAVLMLAGLIFLGLWLIDTLVFASLAILLSWR